MCSLPRSKPKPSFAETIKSLDYAAKTLLERAGGRNAPPSVSRFAEVLDALARSDAKTLEAARIAAFTDFDRLIGEMRQALSAKRVTIDALPADLASDWISPSGQYRVEAFPKGDSNNREVMTAFARQAQTIAPDASGPPIVVAEAGNTVVRAFLELAGLYSFIAIFGILAVALRNATHVALTLGPLLLAGVLSLEAADLLGMSLNFANIIALPLMFAVGVAFHIYYVVAWRKGIVDVLSSSLTRAIFFSSLTTGTAFGSLYSVESSRHREHGRAARDLAFLHVARRLYRRSGLSRPAAVARWRRRRRGALTPIFALLRPRVRIVLMMTRIA